MCIFSGNIHDVRGTEIFARLDGRGGQYLVYSMEYRADSNMAMILPVPVSSHAEDAVQFLSLENYQRFFMDMHSGFVLISRSKGIDSLGMNSASASLLQVHNVGAYEASFIPTLDDFDRLDPRFKLPRQTWDQIPIYLDYGFVVFKLRVTSEMEEEEQAEVKLGEKSSGRYVLGKAHVPRYAARAHPMAFLFPTRAPDALFFPTVHIHDGRCHEKERFDHALFFQGTHIGEACRRQKCAVVSHTEANDFIDIPQTHGIVTGKELCFRRKMQGFYRNQDVWADQFGIIQTQN